MSERFVQDLVNYTLRYKKSLISDKERLDEINDLLDEFQPSNFYQELVRKILTTNNFMLNERRIKQSRTLLNLLNSEGKNEKDFILAFNLLRDAEPKDTFSTNLNSTCHYGSLIRGRDYKYGIADHLFGYTVRTDVKGNQTYVPALILNVVPTSDFEIKLSKNIRGKSFNDKSNQPTSQVVNMGEYIKRALRSKFRKSLQAQKREKGIECILVGDESKSIPKQMIFCPTANCEPRDLYLDNDDMIVRSLRTHYEPILEMVGRKI